MMPDDEEREHLRQAFLAHARKEYDDAHKHRRLILRALSDMEQWASRDDIPAPEYHSRLGTLMRWTMDADALPEDTDHGLRRMGDNLICVRAVRTVTRDDQPTVVCLVAFGDGPRMWVDERDIDWWRDPQDAA